MEQHFASYFGELIHLKLRRRVRSPQLAEDIRQETIYRVLRTLREKDGLQDARKLGAFVSGVCHYVTVELSRSEGRYETSDRDFDKQVDVAQGDQDARLISEQCRKEVRKILGKLDDRDRNLLRAVFLEELGSSEVCRRFQVEPDYLRVLVFRAKARFKQAYIKGASAGA